MANQSTFHPATGYGVAAAERPDRAMVWPIAWLSGLVAFGVLAAVHLSRDISGSTMSKLGDVALATIVSTVLVAGLVYATSGTRRWRWPLITLSVFGLAGAWYAVVAVLPQVLTDARADDNAQTDYSLTTPPTAGDWTRLDGPAALQRREHALERLRSASPEPTTGVADYSYAEYRHPSGAALTFFGLEATGTLQDELRASTRNSLETWATTLGARNLQFTDAGDLGGALACTGSGPGLTAGLVYCAWADASTIGQLTLAGPDADIATAAAVTRSFRAHVTSR